MEEKIDQIDSKWAHYFTKKTKGNCRDIALIEVSTVT